MVAFEPYILNSNLDDRIFFFVGFVVTVVVFWVFFFIIITVRIQHYCLYSDSPNLLPFIMPRPPAPAAL